MTSPTPCDCGSPFQIHMSNDPKCSKLLGPHKTPDVPNPSAIFSGQNPSSQSEIQGLSGEIQHLIAAQNRTTHAVRSIAITFVAAPVISVIVLLADLLAVMSNNIGVIVVVSLIGVIILLVVLVRALTELGQSQVP